VARPRRKPSVQVRLPPPAATLLFRPLTAMASAECGRFNFGDSKDLLQVCESVAGTDPEGILSCGKCANLLQTTRMLEVLFGPDTASLQVMVGVAQSIDDPSAFWTAFAARPAFLTFFERWMAVQNLDRALVASGSLFTEIRELAGAGGMNATEATRQMEAELLAHVRTTGETHLKTTERMGIAFVAHRELFSKLHLLRDCPSVYQALRAYPPNVHATSGVHGGGSRQSIPDARTSFWRR
jgi:hypothetical protein